MSSETCMFGMAGMGLISVLLILLLVLGVAALAKYLFFSKRGERTSVPRHERGEGSERVTDGRQS